MPVRTGAFEDRLATLRRLGLGPIADALETLRENILEEVKPRLDKLEKEVTDMNKRLANVEVRLASVEERINALTKDHEMTSAVVRENREMLSKVWRRQSRHEITLGALTESMLARAVREELAAEGYLFKHVIRNYRIDSEDVDMLAYAEKDGAEVLIAVEIKVKPKHSDVGSLLAKKELIEARRGIPVVPVLAGVWIGSEVETYAESKGVKVLRL